MVLGIGTKAPDFTALEQDGKQVRLSDFLGRTVILYFYPRDNTPGCTTEACGFRDGFETFKRKNVVILGVSTDGVSSHKSFAEKFALPFTLVSDKEKKISQAYGVLKETGMAQRVTFVIDKEGVIEEVFTSVSPAEHASDLAVVFSVRT